MENTKTTPYRHGKIYAIRSHQTDNIFIGNTCNSLAKRMHANRNAYKRYTTEKNFKKYDSSFEVIKYDDHYIDLLENYPCNDKNELNSRTNNLIRRCKTAVNKTHHKVDNLYVENPIVLIQPKQYVEKPIVVIQPKEYVQITCGCGSIYSCKSTHLKTKRHINYEAALLN